MSEVATLDTHWAAAKAREIGFDLCGVAPAEDLAAPEHLADWLARGFAGEMRYLHNPRRGDLTSVMPEARSVIVCALNYDQGVPYSTEARAASSASEKDSPRGWISRYAWGDDYHDVLGEKLELLVAALREKFGDQFAARAYVDTGPISERAAAKVAGIGWLGKNTCLINQEIGSWLFLCVIITSLPIADGDAESIEGRAGEEQEEDIKEGEIPRRLPEERGLLGITDANELEKEKKDQKGKEEADPSAASRPRDDSQIQMQAGKNANAKRPSTNNAGIVGGYTTDGLSKGPRQINLAPDLCGNCTMCLDACPTGALVEPYVMDARRCISYLTIELRGSIPEEFRRDIGWQVFGCDICQDVCPWNRDGGSAARGPERSTGSRTNLDANAELDANDDGHVAAFAPRAGLVAPDLEWLLALTEADFRETFRGSPVKRTKWRGLIRNACVAAGNALRKQRVSETTRNSAQEDSAIRARLAELAAADDAVIAEHAHWALNQ